MGKTPSRTIDSAAPAIPQGVDANGTAAQRLPGHAPGETAASPDDSSRRNLPSVDRILNATPFIALADAFGRTQVKEAVVRHLQGLRRQQTGWNESRALIATEAELEAMSSSSLRRVINGSGIIIHTNLGRSPIDAALWSSASELVAGYSNLEFDLESGGRGARDEHLSELCSSVFGCDASILTNNNAAATLLLLASVAGGRDVLVSRGELVEIGGSFRVPDVIQQGGARLKEVGTTNRTRAADYAEAVTKKTAAILRVHRSNFEIVGFTETPSIAELVEVARSKRIPLLYDEGSGRVIDMERYGFRPGETIRELIEAGVDVVTLSTDKLLGSTQGGLVLGRAALVEKCRRHPLMRALRAGKESYAVLAGTLRAFATGKEEQRIPVYRMLATSLDALRARGEQLITGTNARLVESRCALGGGTTPAETIQSLAVEVPGHPTQLQAGFLRLEPPIAGRVLHDRFTIELRTLMEEDLPHVAAALRQIV